MSGRDSKYSELVEAQYVRLDLVSTTKHTAIDELVDLLRGHSDVTDLEAVRSAVHDREALMSTGVGLGLGLPHAKTTGVISTVVAVGISRDGIEFESVDGMPAKIVFLLVGPDASRSEHIRILSWISRLMNRDDFRSALLAASSAEEVVAIFASADKETFAQ
jgi:mannitol/fructose-specific phosphotransferase system IIA component (Ntr-type)